MTNAGDYTGTMQTGGTVMVLMSCKEQLSGQNLLLPTVPDFRVHSPQWGLAY